MFLKHLPGGPFEPTATTRRAKVAEASSLCSVCAVNGASRGNDDGRGQAKIIYLDTYILYQVYWAEWNLFSKSLRSRTAGRY
jgi:hypothetical protein